MYLLWRPMGLGQIHADLRAPRIGMSKCSAPMHAGNRVDDSQTQTVVDIASRTSVISSVEAFKDTAELGRRDDGPLVFHRDGTFVGTGSLNPDVDA